MNRQTNIENNESYVTFSQFGAGKIEEVMPEANHQKGAGRRSDN
jgi:hypothetical protein